MTTGCRSGSTEPLYFELAWTAARPVPADLRTTVAPAGAPPPLPGAGRTVSQNPGAAPAG